MQQQYVLNRLPIGVVLLDRECRVVSASETARAVFGEARIRDSLGKSIQAMHPPQSRSKLEWLLQESRTEGSSGYASMLVNVPDRVLQLRVVALGDAGGASGYCLLLYDITHLTSRPRDGDPASEDASAGGCLYKLPVSMEGRIALLDIADVTLLRAQGHYTDACAGGKHYFCGLSLTQLESRLHPERFVKVHRSYIVNLAYATAVDRRDDQLVISVAGECAHRIAVSRGKAARVRALLGV